MIKRRWLVAAFMRAVLLLLLLLGSSLSGCIGDGSPSAEEISVDEEPGWKVGDWFQYIFTTPQYGQDTTRLVIADKVESDNNWILAVNSRTEAQRHAVLNHNPFLGRLTFDDLKVYENGIAQSVFNFPMNQGNTWQFTLFGYSWNAEVSELTEDGAVVEAISSGGGEITYTFDGRIGFLTEFTWVDGSRVTMFEMELVDHGRGHTGQVWFIRATDLKDEVYEQTDGEISDTFLDSGHPREGDFDFLVWYLDVIIDASAGSSGSLTVKDHWDATALSRAWGADSEERHAIGTIPSVTGEYSITLHLSGADSYVHLRMAGGVEESWSL
jgi:hypothetical protein